jgi:hypothetical protein
MVAGNSSLHGIAVGAFTLLSPSMTALILLFTIGAWAVAISFLQLSARSASARRSTTSGSAPQWPKDKFGVPTERSSDICSRIYLVPGRRRLLIIDPNQGARRRMI